MTAFSADSVAFYEVARDRLARFSIAYTQSPLRKGWLFRHQVATAARLATIDGRPAEKTELHAALSGAPFFKQRKDFGGRSLAFRNYEVMRALQRFHAKDESSVPARSDSVGGFDANILNVAVDLVGDGFCCLSSIASRVYSARDAVPLTDLRFGVILALCMSGLTPCPAAVAGMQVLATGEGSFATWQEAWLSEIIADAGRASHEIASLERSWLRDLQRLPRSRKTSRIELAFSLFCASGVITPALLAQALGSSVRAASDFLSAFESLGMAKEISHRKARKIFAYRDLVEVGGVTRPEKSFRSIEEVLGLGSPVDSPADDDAIVSVDSFSAYASKIVRAEEPSLDSVRTWDSFLHEIDLVIARSSASSE